MKVRSIVEFRPRPVCSALTATALLLSAGWTAMPALGQEGAAEAGPGPLEEIVVTARRISEPLQSVPAAVSAFSSEKLERLGTRDLGDVQALVPNLTLHTGDASNAVVYIRGVGQIDSLAFADPGVGIYLDDVYLGRAQGAFLDVYDVERIEVLRGPQGTLYGRNTIGGAVKFVSRLPSDEMRAGIEVAAGSYDRLDVKAHLSGPLSADRLYASVAVARLARDGYATNSVDGGDDGDKETLAWRLALRATPSDRFRASLIFDGSDDRPDTSRTPSRETAVFGLVPPNDDPFEVDANFNDVNDLSVRGASASLEWDASETLVLKSITAYRTMKYDTHLDLDATEFDFFGVYVNQDQNQFSQEFQANLTLDRLAGVIGLYYFREHDVTISGLYGPAIGLITGSRNDQTNYSYAVYGQASYDLTDRLSVTAGLRYTFEEKDFARTQEFFPATATLPIQLGTGLLVTDVDTGDEWTSLSPKVGIDYELSPDVTAYANASRGFKSGGFDGRSNTPEQAVAYDPETMWSYEAGLKSVLADRRVTLNVAVFLNDYTDLQLSSFVADAQGGFAALFTNAGSATTKGIEVEAVAAVADGLTLTGTLGWLDAEYDEYTGPGGVDISDDRTPVNSPEWTARLAVGWEGELGVLGTLFADADVAYRSKTYPTVSSSEVLAQDGYALVNAQVALESQDGRWRFAAAVRNLTDRRYITHGFDLSDSLGYQLGYYVAPRTWSFTLGYRF